MQIKINKALVGSTHCLEPSCVTNWSEVLDGIAAGASCTFTIEYNGETLSGAVTINEDRDRLLIAFDQDCVTLPSGSCLDYTCGGTGNPSGKEGPTCNNTKIECKEGLKIAVLDKNGCLAGYVTIEDIIKLVIDGISVDDLINCDTVSRGNLVASDRLLALNESDCSLKSISQDDLVCPKNDCP